MKPKAIDLSPDFIKALAWLILATAALILALGLVWLLVVRPWKKFTGHLETKLGSLELAVNGVEKGEDPLIDKVRSLQAGHEWTTNVLVAFASALNVELPPRPQPRPRTARTRKGEEHHQ